MSTTTIIFATVAIPVLFFMLTWVITTSYRICFPEEPLPFEKDRAALRKRAPTSGQSVPVGVREIREDQRRCRSQRAEALYHYAEGTSVGLPPLWIEDVERRRN